MSTLFMKKFQKKKINKGMNEVNLIRNYINLFESSNQDEQYLNAINNDNMSVVQQMVDNAAKSSGYNIGPVYHGTKDSFTIFANDKRGSNTYHKKDEVGFHFDTELRNAREYAGKNGRVIRVYLKQVNPLRLETETPTSENVKRAESGGFDGIDAPSGYGSNREYVVFNPNQVKSADPVTYDNNQNIIPLSQRFNSSTDDIRY
jgi:hypothetical protein